MVKIQKGQDLGTAKTLVLCRGNAPLAGGRGGDIRPRSVAELKALICFQTRSNHLIRCHRKPVEGTHEIQRYRISWARSTGFLQQLIGSSDWVWKWTGAFKQRLWLCLALKVKQRTNTHFHNEGFVFKCLYTTLTSWWHKPHLNLLSQTVTQWMWSREYR